MITKSFESIPGFHSEAWEPPQDPTTQPSLHEFLFGLHERQGPIAAATLGGLHVVSVGSSEVFRDTRDMFDRPLALFASFLALYTERSLAYANGEDGLTRRRTYINPPFTHSAVHAMLPAFIDAGARLVASWREQSSKPIPYHRQTLEIALNVFCVAVLGLKWDDLHKLDGFLDAYLACWYSLDASMAIERAATPAAQGNISRAVATLQRTAEELFAPWEAAHGRGEELSGCPTIFAGMLEAGISHEQAVADIVITVLAGFHTTASLLTWASGNLAVNQKLQQEVREEVCATFAANPGPIGASHLKAMPLLRACLDETIRLDVVVPIAARCSDEDRAIGGYQVPAGTPIVQSLGRAANDPANWENPAEFNPYRFLTRGSAHAGSYVPFGFAGKRVCPGVDFTYVEAMILMAYIVANFRLSLTADSLPGHRYGIVTIPTEEIFIRLECVPVAEVPAQLIPKV